MIPTEFPGEKLMGSVSVDELKQGMVLSEDVRDINSRLLLSKGQKITPNHLRILKIWGVAQVNVVGHPEEAPAGGQQIDPEKLEKVTAVADVVFHHLDGDNKTIHEVYQASVSYRYRKNLMDGPPPIGHPADAKTSFIKSEVVNKIDKSRIKLPEAPSIIAELNQVISDPLATSNDVAQVVHKSPSLASHLLRIVNSACYGFPSRIDRISRAVTLVGTREISGLALGICILQTFKDIPADIMDMYSFTRHSIACGIVARILAALKNLKDTEQLFVSGLLHDIGKLILYKYFSADARAVFNLAAVSGRSVYETEKQVLGISHAHIGKYLCRKWKLPQMLENNIMYHHTPGLSQDPAKAAIVQMADLIANGLGNGSSGERMIPGFDAEVWNQIGIPNSSLKNVIRQAEHQLMPLETILR
jgi:putative nucleotidyltransferase with HDIG domain